VEGCGGGVHGGEVVVEVAEGFDGGAGAAEDVDASEAGVEGAGVGVGAGAGAEEGGLAGGLCEEDASAAELGGEGEEGSCAGEVFGGGLGGWSVAEGGGVEDEYVVRGGCGEEDGGRVHGLEVCGGGACAAGDDAFLDLE
jgi:hypothetical protein